ncbi:hypothetical protein [Pseudoflavitalea rhizosphaerae]|uniref:hypothetical protein n=1 Tax=Pseudoflavitalea rhizosphaerae TaxID=1884793 RepID=UPI000F8EDEC8|nr:hypothetical protein [Pseudoflavitalea rhizosphaerae]
MKALTLIVLGLLSFYTGFSQFWYNDVLMTKETMKRRDLLVQNRVSSVDFLSFDGANQPIEGFSSQQVITGNGSILTTTTTTPLSGANRNIAEYDTKGLLRSTIDTSDGNRTSIEYYYLPSNKLSRLISSSTSDGQFILKEEHIWTWNNNGKPEKMLKIKNGKDTTQVNFVFDEEGNLVEERSYFRGREQPAVFYYYDEQKRLTDIVRFNERAQRLIPDYIFEYDTNGRIATMLVTSEGDYQKWFYTYDEKGLKAKDECYSKSKVLIGKIQYQYKY